MTARTSTGSITGGCANSSGAWAIGAAATRPQRWANGGGLLPNCGRGWADQPDRSDQLLHPACEAAVAHGARARLVLWADYDPRALVKWVLDHGIDGLSLEGFILNQEFRDTAREAGLSISVGAVNTAEQLDRLLRLEPEIIVSDTPHMIRAMVDASPRHRSRSGGSCRRIALTTPVEILCQQR